ncbi:MAG: HD domain-containing phosphohydrolase, partial [Gemmatimonadaceae bacterium]
MSELLSASEQISLGEVVASLSHALDLTEGQPLGHAMRTCVIGMRIADELRLPSAEKSSLYYALLMKDAGCSANASRFAAVFGTDDRAAKPRMKVADWHRKLGLAAKTFAVAGTGRGMLARIRHFAAIAKTEDFTREIIQTRCERGSAIARRIGFPDETADAILSLDEHWCGLGYPSGKVGDAIPLASRIANIAQTIDAFFMDSGPEAALRVVKDRRGAWFDPRLCDVVKSWTPADAMWRELRSPDLDAVVVGLEPEGRHRTVDSDGLDEVSRAFADIIDAKSPFTWHHSVRVAELAREAIGHMGADGQEQRRLYRAGLLHDIGKLGVSNMILDKPGRLEPWERLEIERHPMHSLAIL